MHYNFEVLTRKLLLKVVTKVEILNYFQSCAAERLDILISLCLHSLYKLRLKCYTLTPKSWPGSKTMAIVTKRGGCKEDQDGKWRQVHGEIVQGGMWKTQHHPQDDIPTYARTQWSSWAPQQDIVGRRSDPMTRHAAPKQVLGIGNTHSQFCQELHTTSQNQQIPLQSLLGQETKHWLVTNLWMPMLGTHPKSHQKEGRIQVSWRDICWVFQWFKSV